MYLTFQNLTPLFFTYFCVTILQNPFTGAGYSKMDVDQINVYQYPNVGKAQWTWATLNPGDCIYVPAGRLESLVIFHCGIDRDVDQINVYQYPNVGKAQWTWATLNPGDCIYVPAGRLVILVWFHYTAIEDMEEYTMIA